MKNKKLKKKVDIIQLKVEEMYKTLTRLEISEIKKVLSEIDTTTSTQSEPFVLPENFYLVVTDDNQSMLREWLVKNNKFLMEGEVVVGEIVGKLKNYDGTFEYGYNPGHVIKSVSYDFGTEITTEQFIKHVLKRDYLSNHYISESVIENKINNLDKPKLEVGKWYKGSEPGKSALLHITSISPSEIKGYGFINNEFKEDTIWYCPENNVKWATENFVLAAPQEVEAALISECERRGFKEGVTIKRPWDDNILKLVEGKPAYYPDMNTLDSGTFTVFNNGEWAEIIKQPKEIDFSIAGQLMEAESGLLVVTQGGETLRTFLGAAIPKTAKTFSTGYEQRYWLKDQFRLSENSITLSNS